MAHSDPNSVFPGRNGPAVCIMSIISDPNGVGVDFTPVNPRKTTSNRDFPTFAPEQVSVVSGKWYYEVELETDGCIQVGAVIRPKFKEISGRGNGVGDGVASWAYDGSKGCVYASKVSITNNIPKATKGDRIGIGFDFTDNTIHFYKNGEEFSKVELAANNSGFEAGKDALTPAASLSGRMTISWFFEKEEIKFLPAEFMPIQLFSTLPVSLSGPVKAPVVGGATAPTGPDPLGLVAVVSDLEQAYAILGNTLANGPEEDKEQAKIVLAFANTRGAFFEYGAEHKLGRFATAGKDILAKITGAVPKLEVVRGRETAEDYLEECQGKLMADRRGMCWTVIALAHVFPNSKTAADFAMNKIKKAIEDFDACFIEAVMKFRYIAALEDRKKNKVLEYGLFWHLERFENELKKDRSKMSVSQQQDFAKEVGKTAEKFVAWRAWFVETVGDIPYHFTALQLVDAALNTFNDLFDPAAMEKEAAQKARDAALVSLNKEIERGKSRIVDAKKEFERFPERAEEGMRKLKQQIVDWEKQYSEAVAAAPEGKSKNLSADVITKLGPAACVATDEFGTWKAELDVAYAEWEREESLRLLKREAKEELRQCKSKLNEAWSLVDHYREQEAIVKLHSAVEAVAELKSRPGFLGLDFLDEFFFGADGYESLKAKIEKKIYDVMKNRACHEHARILNGHVSQMKNLLDHYRNEDSLIEYNKSQDKIKEIYTLSEDYQNEEKLADAIKSYNEQAPQYLQAYKERVVFVKARDATGDLRRKLSTVEDMVSHYRETEALAAAAEVEEKLDALKNDIMLGTAPAVIELAQFCGDKLPELRAQANKQIIDREVKEALRVLEGTYDDVKSHFDHYRFEHCLQALAKYKELGAELERERRYRGRADVEESLNNVDTRIPEFEKIYRDKMAKRALEEDLRVARGDFGTANDMFDHSRFDECLEKLQQAREKVDALEKNEMYSDGGELAQVRDSFVKTSREETIPQFLAKYTEKVVTRKAQDVAREIRSGINTAKHQLDHHQYELCLETISKTRDQIANARPSDEANLPLDAEPWLVYNHAITQEAVNTASKDIFELTKQFEEQQFERKTAEMIRNLNDPLGQAKHLLDHSNFEGALTSLSKAQEALAELSLIASPKAASSVAQATKDIEEFQQQYATTMSKRRDDDLSRAVRSEISTAEDMFSHHRNEDTLKAITKAREQIDNVTQQGSAALISQNVAEWNKQLESLEKQYAERVLTREATDSVSAIRSDLKFANDHHDHHRDEAALVSLNAAREKVANLIINTRISQLPQVVSYLEEFNKEQPAWDQKLAQRALDKETNENVRLLRGGLAELKSAFDHHQNEKAVTVYSKIVDELLPFTNESRFASQPSVADIKAEAETQTKAFLEDYRNRVVSNKFQEHQRNANHKFDEAVDKLGRSMFSEAIESYYEARDLVGKIGGDSLMIGYPPADSFIAEFAPKIEDFRKQIAQKQRERALENAKRDVSSCMNKAKDDFDHHRDEMSLKSLNEARDFLETYEREFGSDAFVAEQKAAQVEFNKTYAARVFEAELSRRERKCNERRNAAKDAFAHSRFEEAIRALSEADECAKDIGTDDRFLHLDRVGVFLKSHIDEATSIRFSIQTTIKDRAAKEALRNINHAIDDAKSCYDHYRFDQSLQSCQKAIELIYDAAVYQTVNETDLAPLQADIAAFKKKFQEERLAAEVEAQIRAVHSILNSARFMLSHHRHEDCMKSLQQARDEAAKVGDSKYAGLASVLKFFEEWPTLFRGIESELNEKLFAIRVRDAISAVKSAIHESETCVAHHMHERAMTSLQKARDLIDELKDSADLSVLAAVVAFVAESTATVDGIAQRVADELFAREVEDVIRGVKSNVERAEQLFSRFAYEVALQAFNAAKEAVVNATNPSDSRIAASKTLTAYVNTTFTPFVQSFSQKYADAVLADDARKASSTVKAALSRCVLYLDRNVREKCIEELVAAQEAAQEAFVSEESMLRTMPVAAQILAEVKSVHQRVSATFLQADADEAIRAARKITPRVQVSLQRLLDCSADLDALREAVAPLLGSDEKKEPVAPIYSALPSVFTFLATEIQPVFKAARKPLYDEESGSSSSSGSGGKSKSASGASSGHNFEEDPACLGKTITSRWPQVVELRKGLPNKSIGPDVHPRYFDGLKQGINQGAKNIATRIKELEKAIMNDYDWTGKPDVRAYPFIKRMYEEIDFQLQDYVKGMKRLESDIGDEEKRKNDEFLQSIIAGFDKFMTAWAETKNHFNAVEKTVLRYRAMRKGQDICQNCFNECREVSNYASNCHLQRSVFADFFSVDSLYDRFPLWPFKWQSIWTGRSGGSPEQHEMFMVTSKVAKTMLETMQTWAKDYPEGKFPNQEHFEKYFHDIMAKCKKEHAQLGFRRICQTGINEEKGGGQRKSWFEALRKFPIARKYAVELGNKYAYDYERTAGRPWFTPNIVDPIPADAQGDADEQESWYAQSWTWVLDMDPAERSKLSYDKKPDQSTAASSEVYTSVCKKNAGKIVFANSFINEQGVCKTSSDSFTDKFDLKSATEGAGIFARAFWPRSISNYPIAKDNKTGKLIYGPDDMNSERMHCEILLKAFIDGKQIDNEFKVDDAVTSMTQRDKPKKGSDESDFYAMNQTCRIRVLADDLNDPKQLRDTWHNVAGRFAYEFSTLAPGDHTVELQLCFRLVSSYDNAFTSHPEVDAKKRLFPFYTSPVSSPIATGSFTLNVPKTPVPRRSILPAPLPLAKTAPGTRAALEKQIMDHMGKLSDWGGRSNKKENVFYVTITSDSRVNRVETFIIGEDSRGRYILREEPVGYGRDFRCLIRRKKSEGWPRETVAYFALEAVTPEVRNPPTDIDQNGIAGIWVAIGSHFEVDARFLSEEDAKLVF